MMKSGAKQNYREKEWELFGLKFCNSLSFF